MKKVIGVVALSVLFASLMVSCTAPSPVDGIFLFKARPGQPPPTGPFHGAVNPNPHPTEVQVTFNQGDKIFRLGSQGRQTW